MGISSYYIAGLIGYFKTWYNTVPFSVCVKVYHFYVSLEQNVRFSGINISVILLFIALLCGY
jgi:hypothetical protein